MKYLFKLLISLTFLLFLTSNSFSDSKIAFIDMNKIMTKSKAGISITGQLEKMHKKNISSFEKSEKELKKEEASIVAQKNVLSKEEFQKKIESLRNKANEYRTERTSLINSLTKKRVDATNKLLKVIHPILTEYSTEKSISILMQKKNIIIGKNELDITEDILKILDKKINKISLN